MVLPLPEGPRTAPHAPLGAADLPHLVAFLLLTLLPLGGCGPPGGEGHGSDAAADAPVQAESEEAASPATMQEPSAAPGVLRGDPAGTEPPRVVFLGTSLTAGFGLLRESERWTDQLQVIADTAGLPFEAVNAGVSGDTSAGGLRRLERLLAEPLDVLVLELGANDGLRGLDPDRLEDNLRAVVRGTRERYPEARIVLVGMEAPPNLGRRYTDRFREIYRSVAEDLELPFVPFLLEGVAGVPELNQADRIHPTAEGHRRIARTVWPVLEPVLRAEWREVGRSGGR